MKRVIAFCSLIALASCSAEHERQQSMKEALAGSQDCRTLPTHGMRARCIGSRMLQADQRNSINPKYDIQKISAMTQVEDAVDRGQISEQDANQRITLAFSAIDAQAKSDDGVRSRRAWRNALMGIGAGMQGASNGYANSIRQNQSMPTFNCTTMPMGAGQTTTHCY